VHEPNGSIFLPPSLFDRGSTTALQETASRLAALLLNKKTPNAPSQLGQGQRNHAFSIFANIMQDPLFPQKPKVGDPDKPATPRGADIWRHVEHWTIDLSQPGEIERKMEECIWTNTLVFAIGGWGKKKGFNADFFL